MLEYDICDDSIISGDVADKIEFTQPLLNELIKVNRKLKLNLM